jgi:hypothetical protein
VSIKPDAFFNRIIQKYNRRLSLSVIRAMNTIKTTIILISGNSFAT